MEKEVILTKSPIFTDAVLEVLKNEFDGLNIEKYSDKFVFDGRNLEERSFLDLQLDLAFFYLNKNIPLENICSRLNNYVPRNKTQEEVLHYANLLLNLENSASAAGLWMCGGPGIGKTHIAISLAKEYFRRRESKCFYLSYDNYLGQIDLKRKLGPDQIHILDDMNTTISTDFFQAVILNAHENGGKVFITSNINYDDFIAKASFHSNAEKERYLDRAKSIFKILHVEGESKRSSSPWYNNVTISDRKLLK